MKKKDKVIIIVLLVVYSLVFILFILFMFMKEYRTALIFFTILALMTIFFIQRWGHQYYGRWE
jgi:hypothetical protein